jgi:hypothetical protein
MSDKGIKHAKEIDTPNYTIIYKVQMLGDLGIVLFIRSGALLGKFHHNLLICRCLCVEHVYDVSAIC